MTIHIFQPVGAIVALLAKHLNNVRVGDPVGINSQGEAVIHGPEVPPGNYVGNVINVVQDRNTPGVVHIQMQVNFIECSIVMDPDWDIPGYGDFKELIKKNNIDGIMNMLVSKKTDKKLVEKIQDWLIDNVEYTE